jgi:2,3-bisphosphoglycerate-independent phosphoglycerate mutase
VTTVLVILDGLADEPAAVLGGRTPLEAADTPHLDRLAAAGQGGRFDPTPPGADPGSEVGVPACLGLPADPGRPARARLEALGRGVPVAPGEAVFRATCVHVSGPLSDPESRLRSVADPEATHEAVAALVPRIAALGARLHPDPHGRHLIVVPGAPDRATVPPHDLAGLPLAAGGPLPPLWAHLDGLLPDGLALWPWGGGGTLPGRADCLFETLITGVDLVRGIGRAAGLACPVVPGATGGADTDFGAKARAALAAARNGSVAVHVEAPDMAAHRRDPVAKANVIARADRELIGPLADAGVRLLVTADHATSSRTGRHLEGPVPFLRAEVGERGPAGAFSEAAVADAPVLDGAAWRALLAAEAVPC